MVAVPGVVETGPRTETVGPAALLERLIERGPKPWRHVLSLCVADGVDALVEGVLVADTGVATSSFVASARISGDGLLERYLAFSCPGARDPLPMDDGAATVPADAATAVRGYFTALDAGRFAKAASHFSDDVLYSHPPYKHTAPIRVFRAPSECLVRGAHAADTRTAGSRSCQRPVDRVGARRSRSMGIHHDFSVSVPSVDLDRPPALSA